MSYKKSLSVFLCILATACTNSNTKKASKPNYPESKQIVVVDEYHGQQIPDPFRWLEQDNTPETRQWLKAQQAFANTQLSNLDAYPAFKQTLERLAQVEQHATPSKLGEFTFVERQNKDSGVWQYFVSDAKGKERILLDPFEFSEDGSARVSIEDTSNDGKLIAYGVTLTGADEQEIRFRTVESGDDLDIVLPYGLYNQIDFKADGTGFFYTKRNRAESVLIYEHTFGNDPVNDMVIFGQGIPLENWIWIDESASGRYRVFNVSHGWSRSDLYFVDTQSEQGLVTIVEGMDGSFNTWFIGDRLFVSSDVSANNGEIYEVDWANPNFESWATVIKQNPQKIIQSVSAIDNKHIVTYLHNVQNELHLYSPNGEHLQQLPVPAFSTVTSVSINPSGDDLFFGVESYLSPRTTYQYTVGTNAISVYAKTQVPFDSEQYEVEQSWVSSKDGTQVPIFILGKKGFKERGPLPTILYGYGGFAYSLTPHFYSPSAAWLEMGGLYAFANIRGGLEFGKEWHRQGQLENKQNVFDDFIAAANWLKDNNYTRTQQLAIQGGSNGGLLVGAVITQQPDIANVVICQVPDLDMIGYYRFENNNAPALLEYGNASIKEQFEYLIKYSPYQNVKEGVEYPAIYISSGDFDTRVPPLQARKMTAKLQQYTAGSAPIVLKYSEQGGHTGGGMNLQSRIEMTAEYYAFTAKHLGLKAPDTILVDSGF